MRITGNQLLAKTLKRLGVDTGFFLMGGPMTTAESCCIAEGIRMIDVRHEQAAAMMAHSYARIRSKPGVCIAASGPGVLNLVTGVANAFVDCAPLLVLGGSSTLKDYGRGSFQEIDQVGIMRPITKWCERVYEPRRIPELVATAYRQTLSGKPGPAYLDFPGDLLFVEIDEDDVRWPSQWDWQPSRAAADPDLVRAAVGLLEGSKRPIIVSGTGVFWTHAEKKLHAFVDQTGIPFYTTPQGRGAVPEDHQYFYGAARSTAFREADCVIVVGTRLNYVLQHGMPPRFNPAAEFIRIDADDAEFARGDVAALNLLGDAGLVVEQMGQALAGKLGPAAFKGWRERLKTVQLERSAREEREISTDQRPVHPLRLCKEIRDFMERDAILVVDGQEILNFGRRVLPTYRARHRLNSGPFGTMGVGLPFGIGAKAASPDAEVIVLHGDGSFGMNGMELDVAVRHKLPVIVVISLNGGWTADPEGTKAGRYLGYTRFDKFAEALGCHGEFIDEPEQIRPALERARLELRRGRSSLINVVTDANARAETVKFATYST